MAAPKSVSKAASTQHLAPVDDSLNYISWALPQTLIPLINSKLHSSLIPPLDFSDPSTRPKKRVRFAADYQQQDDVVAQPAAEPVKAKTSSDLFGLSAPAEEAAERDSRTDILADLDDPLLTFKELWQKYDRIFRYLKGCQENASGGDRFFDWLDETVERGRLEARVYRALRNRIEDKMREKLEWAHRKFTVERYRQPVDDAILRDFEKAGFSAQLPHQPDSIGVILKGPNLDPGREFDYDHVLVMRDAIHFGHFPAIMATQHTGKAKAKIRRVIDRLHRRKKKKNQKRQNPMDSPAGDFVGGGNEQYGKKRVKRLGGQAEKTTSSLKGDLEEARESASAGSSVNSRSNTKREKRRDTVIKKKRGKKKRQTSCSSDEGCVKAKRKTSTDDEDDDDDEDGSDDSGSEKSVGSVDWTVRPVETKRKWHQHYTREELDKMRQFALRNYNFHLEIKERVDIGAKDLIFENGPGLSAPVILQLVCAYLREKRWRLLDLFTCADKNKTWRLNQSKIHNMCRYFGFSDVTNTAITDFIVALVEETSDTLRYKDIRRGMLEWVRERRIRLRYCQEVDGFVPTVEESLLGEAEEEERLINNGQISPDANSDDTNLVRFCQAEENRQPIMPPEEIGTEVCDEAGRACTWHPVFPESMILAWRIQQRLRFLARTGRWLGVQNILALFGKMRVLSESATELIRRTAEKEARLRDVIRSRTPAGSGAEDSANKSPFDSSTLLDAPVSSTATLEALAKDAPVQERLSLADMHTRYSLNVVAKKKTPTTPNEQEMQAEEDACHLEQLRVWGVSGGRGTRQSSRGSPKKQKKDGKEVVSSDSDIVEDDFLDIFTKTQSVHRLETLDDRTELDKYLRGKFRNLHNTVMVDPLPNDVLETLQLRAARLLEKYARSKAERREAAMDPLRRNDSMRDLVAEFSEIVKDAQSEVRTLYGLKKMTDALSGDGDQGNDTSVGTLKPSESAEMCKTALRNKLLTEMRGLHYGPPVALDSRTKMVMTHARRLKSVMEHEGSDPRKCFVASPSSSLTLVTKPVRQKRGTAKLNEMHFFHADSLEKDVFGVVMDNPHEYQYTSSLPKRKKISKLRNVSLECFSDEEMNALMSGPIKHPPPDVYFDRNVDVPISGFPELDQSKAPKERETTRHLTMEELLFGENPLTEKMVIQLNFLLDVFLREERNHLVHGLTKDISELARVLPISRYQEVEVIEKKLVNQRRLSQAADDYITTVRRNMQTDFRHIGKSDANSRHENPLPKPLLRQALLRPEDFEHEVLPYTDALAGFHIRAVDHFPNGTLPNRTHKKWYKQFRSLPEFFPLPDEYMLMRSIATKETADGV